MKALLKYGGFYWWDYPLKEEDVGRSITISKPLSTTRVADKDGNLPNFDPPGFLVFEPYKRLDALTYEYHFTREER